MEFPSKDFEPEVIDFFKLTKRASHSLLLTPLHQYYQNAKPIQAKEKRSRDKQCKEKPIFPSSEFIVPDIFYNEKPSLEKIVLQKIIKSEVYSDDSSISSDCTSWGSVDSFDIKTCFSQPKDYDLFGSFEFEKKQIQNLKDQKIDKCDIEFILDKMIEDELGNVGFQFNFDQEEDHLNG